MITDPKNAVRRSGIRSTIDDNLISFINVIFLILIFFMIAGKIEQSSLLQIEPPASSSDKNPMDTTVTVLIDASGTVAIGDRVIAPEAIQQRLSSMINEQPDTRFAIKADQGVDMTAFRKLLGYINNAGVSHVSVFAATR